MSTRCVKCSGLVYGVEDINSSYMSCILCGAVYFYGDTSDTVDYSKCQICYNREYVEDICLPISICGICYVNALYENPYILIGGREERTDRLGKNIIRCLYNFNEQHQIRFENYVHNRCCMEDISRKSLIKEIGVLSGIPRFIIKDIILAMKNIREGVV